MRGPNVTNFKLRSQATVRREAREGLSLLHEVSSKISRSHVRRRQGTADPPTPPETSAINRRKVPIGTQKVPIGLYRKIGDVLPISQDLCAQLIGRGE